jgi:hypothetical protein
MLVMESKLRVKFIIGMCLWLRLVTPHEAHRRLPLSKKGFPVLVDQILV